MTFCHHGHYDYLIVGSGFGGSVCALRLAEKGYSVLMVEKGRRLGAADFPKTNWNLRRWLWLPALGCRGLFKLTFFRHVTILSGVGVGGGSLVYANTLPVPKQSFFTAKPWGELADWRAELQPHYDTARRMLGATTNPLETAGDRLLREIATEDGRRDEHEPTQVAVYFGPRGETVPDPYFGGAGPERAGCIFCGGCMLGCRHNAKNTLDKNYLYLAEKLGARIMPDTRVDSVRPMDAGGYLVEGRTSVGWMKHVGFMASADRVVFSGGVLGTVDLLQKMRADPQALPGLSPRVGDGIRTNSESLIGVVSTRRDVDFTEGVAITSILHTGEHSHVEPVRYSRGSGFWRLLSVPHAPGANLWERLRETGRRIARTPWRWLRTLATWDFARHSLILLYMKTLDGTLSFRQKRRVWLGLQRTMTTSLHGSTPPAAFLPEATDIADRIAAKVDGVTMSLFTETLAATPSTAHILGGCCMGRTPEEGVIDTRHRVFGYPGLYVVDGSAVSANPGVNPSLTITAMAERAMSFIPAKQ